MQFLQNLSRVSKDSDKAPSIPPPPFDNEPSETLQAPAPIDSWERAPTPPKTPGDSPWQLSPATSRESGKPKTQNAVLIVNAAEPEHSDRQVSPVSPSLPADSREQLLEAGREQILGASREQRFEPNASPFVSHLHPRDVAETSSPYDSRVNSKEQGMPIRSNTRYSMSSMSVPSEEGINYFDRQREEGAVYGSILASGRKPDAVPRERDFVDWISQRGRAGPAVPDFAPPPRPSNQNEGSFRPSSSLHSSADAAGGTGNADLASPQSIGRTAEDAAGVGPLSYHDTSLADLVFLSKETSLLATGANVVAEDGFGARVNIEPGVETPFEVNLDANGRFCWTTRDYSGNRDEMSAPPSRTNWIVAYIPANGREISWSFYAKQCGLPPGVIFIGSNAIPFSGDVPILVKDGYGGGVSIPKGGEKSFQLKLDAQGFFQWSCGSRVERTRPPSVEVDWIRAKYPASGGEIIWRYYSTSARLTASPSSPTANPISSMFVNASTGISGTITEGAEQRPESSQWDQGKLNVDDDSQQSDQFSKPRGLRCRRCTCTCADFPFCTMHCPCLFAAIFFLLVFALTGGLFTTPEIDTDFDSFLEADSRANEVRIAFLNSLKFRGAQQRRLTIAGIYGGQALLDSSILHQIRKLELYYRAKENGGLLSLKVLTEIRDFEAKLKNLPGWKTLCGTYVTPMLSTLCEPGASLANLVYPVNLDIKAQYQTLEKVKYNLTGKGREALPMEAVLELTRKMNYRVAFFPKTFGGTNTNELRSMFEFPLAVCTVTDTMAYRDKQLARLTDLYDKFTREDLYPLLQKQAADKSASFKLNWSGDNLDTLEVWDTLMRDVLYAIGSCGFIFLYLTFHTKSPLLSTISLFFTLLSIPVAFVTSARLSGGSQITGASFLSLFLIVGLGADDVLVFVSAFEISRAKYGYDYEVRLRYLYKTAGKACLATTLTTSASFFANLASVLKPLREFGFFMGLCILDVYIFLLVGLPPVLIANEKLVKYLVRSSSGQRGTMSYILKDPDEESLQDPALAHRQRAFVSVYFQRCVWPYRKVCLGVFVVVPLIMLIWTGAVAEVDGDMPQMFPDEHNQNIGKKVKEKFPKISEMHVMNSVYMCNVGRAYHRLPAYMCQLTWCHVGIGTLVTHGAVRKNGSECTCMPTEPKGNDKICRPFQAGPNGSGSLFDQEIEAEVRFVGLDAGDIPPSFWNSNAWFQFLTTAVTRTNGAQLTIGGFTPMGSAARNLSKMVQEHWESGSVRVSAFTLAPRIKIRITAGSQLQTGNYCDPSYICYCGAPACKFRDQSLMDPGIAASQWSSLSVPPRSGGRRLERHAKPKATMQVTSALSGMPDTDEMGQAEIATASRTAFLPRVGRSLYIRTGVDVNVVWGMKVTSAIPLLGDPPKKPWAFDPAFRPDGPRSQRHLFNACNIISNHPELQVASSVCWIAEFRDYLIRKHELFPARATRFYYLLGMFQATGLLQGGNSVTDFMWLGPDGTLKATYVQLQIGVSKHIPSQKALELMNKWNDVVDGINSNAPMDAPDAWHTSSLWIRAEAEKAIVDSTLATLMVAMACGFLGTFVFTNFEPMTLVESRKNCFGNMDVMLSIFVTLSVIGVTICLAYFMSVLMGWAIGAIEVLGLIVFVGYSITYSLHIAHKYSEHTKNHEESSIADRRKKAVRHALELMSNSVMGSALTTLGASFFLFFCDMAIFVKLAAVLFAVTFFAAVYSLVALPAALLVCGPVGVCGCGAVVARVRGESLGYETDQGDRCGAREEATFIPSPDASPESRSAAAAPGFHNSAQSCPGESTASNGFHQCATDKSEVYRSAAQASPMTSPGTRYLSSASSPKPSFLASIGGSERPSFVEVPHPGLPRTSNLGESGRAE